MVFGADRGESAVVIVCVSELPVVYGELFFVICHVVFYDFVYYGLCSLKHVSVLVAQTLVAAVFVSLYDCAVVIERVIALYDACRSPVSQVCA